MGGAAFSAGPNPLFTPRMSPAVYEAVRGRCQAVLRELFVLVATPIEGPAKKDYGDVDMLVAVAREADSGADGDDSGDASGGDRRLQEAARRLGAVRAIYAPGKVTLAVPWPEEEEEGRTGEHDEKGKVRHVQVDLSVTPSPAALEWSLFRHAHGDMWTIMGSVLRPLGLTIDETALWLRVAEIERANRRRARVFLSSEPADVLSFLGLPVLAEGEDGKDGGVVSLWEHPFPDAQSLFEYMTLSPFFVLPPPDDTAAVVLAKANDRRRMQHRPMFQQWIADFIPAHRQRMEMKMRLLAGRGPPVPTRASVRAAAFAHFAGSQARYEHSRTEWLLERRSQDVWAAAKAAVPANLPGRYRSAACAAVRRRLEAAEGPDEPERPEQPEQPEAPEIDTANCRLEMTTGLAAWTVDGAAAFVAAHWQALTAAAAPEEHAHYLRFKEKDREDGRIGEK